jgi:predicted metal-dependent peptidase
MNANMLCPLRSGKGRIEYNPTIIEAVPDTMLRDLMRIEVIRILLQHPYARQPMGCPSLVLQTASDLVISPAYNLAWANLAHPEDFDLPTGQHYEWYAYRLSEMAVHRDGDAPSEGDSGGEQGEGSSQNEKGEQEQQQGQGDGQGEQQEQDEKAVHQDGDAPSRGNSGGRQGEGSSQTTEAEQDQEQGQGGSQQGEESTEGNCQTKFAGRREKQQSTDDGQSNEGDDEASASDKPSSGYTDLWEEDQFQMRQITDIVKGSTSWGSLPSFMIELIKKAAEGKIDYRAVLRMFRASIISQKRRLTRMRPSRRFGFEQMGSRYDFTTRLLIAIDTSCSVGSEELGRYFRIITTFFKYGIQEIDVLMFDTVVHGDPLPLTEAKKSKQEFKVEGRGGTHFQPPIDYMVAHPQYDGLIILTDGCAPNPELPPHLRTKLLWVIDNEASYKYRYDSLRKTGRVCLMEM